MPQNYKVFLASQSPRRRQLLGSLFNNIDILRVDFDEPRWQRKELARNFMLRCLKVKWRTAIEKLPHSATALLVVADTMVVLRGDMLGKPSSKREAQKMLSKLSGQSHEVLTAYHWAFLKKGKILKTRKKIISSRVQFRKLSKVEIRQYVNTGEPMDKAGSYAFQGLGLKFIKKAEGSYSNVIGFPVLDFKKDLRSAKLL